MFYISRFKILHHGLRRVKFENSAHSGSDSRAMETEHIAHSFFLKAQFDEHNLVGYHLLMRVIHR